MSIRFLDPELSTELRSSEFARRVLATAAGDGSVLASEILAAKDWRRWYLGLYARLAIEEGKSKTATSAIATRGLAAFHKHLICDSGDTLEQDVAAGWGRSLVTTIVISGSKAAERITIPGQSVSLEQTASGWVADNLAEPGLIEAFRFLDSANNLEIRRDLLFAVAGMAEFAPTEHWLSWGGRVAVVARPNPMAWRRLIDFARNSGGELMVPIKTELLKNSGHLTDDEIAELAGLDILSDYQSIAAWLADQSKSDYRKLVLGLYGYTPKTNHIRLQGVQDALIAVALENVGSEKLALSWLATPTDSAPGPDSIAQAQLELYRSRKPLQVLRDSLLGLFNAARKPSPKFFESESGESLCLIDASVQQQGPSYSFSKRTQRWRAYLAHYRGITISYAISPPARTNSVLRHRILRASYRGAPKFGVKPFEVAVAKAASAAVLAHDLHNPEETAGSDSTTKLHTSSAIHAGLWRHPYRPSSVWLAATVIGLPALFRKGY